MSLTNVQLRAQKWALDLFGNWGKFLWMGCARNSRWENNQKLSILIRKWSSYKPWGHGEPLPAWWETPASPLPPWQDSGVEKELHSHFDSSQGLRTSIFRGKKWGRRDLEHPHPTAWGWGYPDPVASCSFPVLCWWEMHPPPFTQGFPQGKRKKERKWSSGSPRKGPAVPRICCGCLCSNWIQQRETTSMKTVSSAKGQIIFWDLLNFFSKLLLHLQWE